MFFFFIKQDLTFSKVHEGPSTLSAMSNPSFLGDFDVSYCCNRLLAKKERAILLLNSIDLTARETNYLLTFRSNLISRRYGVAGRCLRNLVIECGRSRTFAQSNLRNWLKIKRPQFCVAGFDCWKWVSFISFQYNLMAS